MNRRFVVSGVDAGTPLRLAAPAILLSKSGPLFELEMSARGGADMDAVHDMRVASRRLREAMRLLGPLYPRRESRTWYRRIRSITRALGPVRDSDVFIDAFGSLASEVGDGGKRAIAFMVGFRLGQRVQELALLNRELSHLDLDKNRKQFARFAESLVEMTDVERSLADFAHAEVASRAAVVFAAQPLAVLEVNILEQHQLRIDYKRLRYAVEAFAPCYVDSFNALHSTLTAFQDALGDLHDAHVFLEMLSEPNRTDDARRAGVSASDIAEVVGVIEARAHQEFLRFVGLADEHPPEQLLPSLLLPLAESRGSSASVPGTDGEPGKGPSAERVEAEPHSSEQEVLPPHDDTRVLPLAILSQKPWEDGWAEGIIEV